MSTETPNTYSVGCSTLTTGPDGAPTAPPAAVFPEVTIGIDCDQWLVSGAVVGGLVLPSSLVTNNTEDSRPLQ